MGSHYSNVFYLTSEAEGSDIEDPIERVFKSDALYEMDNHAVLVSREGKRYYLEDSAAPIKDEKENTVGVVVVFRDVTSKQEQRREIEYLSFHDSLTGLYNRRFFEEELHRLDTERNLPISIIFGDINGLKLTNDILGHSTGDALIKKASEILKKACRDEDIVARVGGDEFMILLPKTEAQDAERS
jgi:PleD family two-component response regulator